MLEDLFIPNEEKIILDLHDMQEDEARYYLEKAIDTAEPKIKEIVVVHGYRKGQIILNMVRKEFKHKKIERKEIPFNKGITLIYLKQ
ncbi:MAG: Smr/MutS family protein [Clostridia bacterium]|nr:Smr/MutS family protein [Clostridia bacterium]